MNTSAVIKTTGLSYHYSKDVQTLFGIDLNVEQGSVYGFLGPNGSGKTTTLSLLLGLLNNQQGEIEIFGERLHTNRMNILRRIGSLIETPSLYGHLTAIENLQVYREIYGASKARIAEVLNIADLKETGNKTVKKFSLGMKQRLAIALALLPNPELLILDEPANGLDPAGIIELRELIKSLNREHGMTIMISSHFLGEVEKMVSHVGIIFKGSMIFQGPLADLQSFKQKASRIFIKTSDNEAALQLLQEFKAEREGDALCVPFANSNQVAAINKKLTGNNLEVYQLNAKESDLEQLFIDLTTTKK